jgi:hypothetical protein
VHPADEPTKQCDQRDLAVGAGLLKHVLQVIAHGATACAEGEGIELGDKSRILTGRGGIKAAF